MGVVGQQDGHDFVELADFYEQLKGRHSKCIPDGHHMDVDESTHQSLIDGVVIGFHHFDTQAKKILPKPIVSLSHG